VSRADGGSRVAGAFARARAEGRAAFIPFLTCGDPDPSSTLPLCEALARAGADIIELGVPFSDPLADGPTIQRASERALAHGVGLALSLDLAAQIRRRVAAALILFTYYNPILRMGEERFAQRAVAAGVDGVLVTDLPLEEGSSLRRLLIDRGVDPILLVAPTSGKERIARAAAEARGFIYYVSRTGVTGEQARLPAGLAQEVQAVRGATDLPIAVGFGISTPDQVRGVAALADGVVVGSALVRAVEKAREEGGAPADAGTLARILEQEAARLCAAARREAA
jgi:tryptophan synthase alpha chain